MKELLKLQPGCDGAAWSYASSGSSRRRSHRHEELELNLVLSGSAKYLVRERRFNLGRGTLIWLFPEQDHLLLNESRDYSMWIVVIRSGLLGKVCREKKAQTLLSRDPGEVLIRSIRPRGLSWLSSICEDIFASAGDTDRYNAGLSYAVLSAWAAFNSANDTPLGQHVHPAVEKAARLLRDENHSGNLDALARSCDLSRSRLSRLFNQQAGISLVDYRQRQCLERFFAHYGRGRRMTMLDAALHAGFGSYASFHRVFTRLMHKSPAEYRRRQAES